MGVKATKERDVLKACLDYLKLRGIPAVRVNGGGMRAPGPGGRTRYVRFTSAPGCADILAVLPPAGRFAGIEVKRPGGRLTPHQAAFAAAVRKAGGIALVVDSVGKLVEELERLGG